ncbi:MAG: Crp/Fnr family transcriptional regulator [Chloroflexi bacterium]|nr:MAG: Crp/Fnr family transcriptional regulator [Chloroflexota bacterium]
MKPKPSLEQLSQLLNNAALFARLDAKTKQRLVQTARWREVQTGEVLMLEGEQMPGLYVLQYGWVKVVKSSVSGREQVLRYFEPGEMFNEIGILTDKPNPATVIALEPAGLWLISRQAMRDLLQSEPDFAQHVIEQLADRMVYLVSLITDISLRPVTERLARLLLDSAIAGVVHRPRWYTQAELAARLGTVPDVIQRALRNLENEGVLTVQRKKIQILDRSALEKIAS